MTTELSTTDKADFKKLKTAAIAALELSADSWRVFIGHLKEIQKRELWRLEAKTWREFLDTICTQVSVKHRQFYNLLRAEEVRLQLVEKVSAPRCTQNDETLAKTIKTMSTKALLEVAKEAPEDRLKVVEEASKQFEKGKAPTAPAVAAAAKAQEHKPKPTKLDKPPAPLDSTGTKIPGPALSFWERRNEVQPWLNQISEIKCAIEKAKKAGDSLYSWIGTPAIDALNNAFTTISNAKLYAVCTKCQGWWDRMSGGGCSTCHNTGLISKHQYDVCSPAEIKAMREKSNRTHL